MIEMGDFLSFFWKYELSFGSVVRNGHDTSSSLKAKNHLSVGAHEHVLFSEYNTY